MFIENGTTKCLKAPAGRKGAKVQRHRAKGRIEFAGDRYVRNRRGGVPPPDGLGDPTPTDSTFPFSRLESC